MGRRFFFCVNPNNNVLSTLLIYIYTYIYKEQEQQTHGLMLLLRVSCLSAIFKQLLTLQSSQSFHANTSSATRMRGERRCEVTKLGDDVSIFSGSVVRWLVRNLRAETCWNVYTSRQFPAFCSGLSPCRLLHF